MSRFTTVANLLLAVSGSVSGITSDIFDVSARKNMSIHFISGSGNGVYEVLVSNDGTNFVTYDRLTTNATNTNSQTDIGVSTITVNAGSSAIYFIRNGDHFRYIRGSVTATTGIGSSLNAILSAID